MIVAALLHQGEQVLFVKQQGPDDPAPTWALPGGRVEGGELLDEALRREVRQETGIEIQDAGRLLYIVQVDRTVDSSQTICFVFDVRQWQGSLQVADPDQFILQAHFLPVPEVIQKLAELPWREMSEPILAHLKGESGPGTTWIYREQVAGHASLVRRIG